MNETTDWVAFGNVARGARIGVFAPAGPVHPEAYRAGLGRLRERYEVVEAPNVFARDGYFAGSDRTRLRAVQEMMDDRDIRAMIAARGGYGGMRLLEGLDLSRFSDDPIPLVGFSDITAFSMAFGARNLTSVHGPVVSQLGALPEEDWLRLIAVLEGGRADRARPGGHDVNVTRLGRHRLAENVRATWLGGNLSLIAALVGTPWLPTLRSRLLFLEEVAERPYRIDRMLVQMALAGCFDGVVAVVLGDFTRCEPPPEGGGPEALSVVRDCFDTLMVPVYAGFPAGHGARNQAFVVGGQAALQETGERDAVVHFDR